MYWFDVSGRFSPCILTYLLLCDANDENKYSLALCELHLVMAVLALRVFPKMRLYETTPADVEYDHDLNISQPSLKSKGVRVIML